MPSQSASALWPTKYDRIYCDGIFVPTTIYHDGDKHSVTVVDDKRMLDQSK